MQIDGAQLTAIYDFIDEARLEFIEHCSLYLDVAQIDELMKELDQSQGKGDE